MNRKSCNIRSSGLGRRARRGFGAMTVIVLAAGLFTCADKDKSPTGPDNPPDNPPPHIGGPHPLGGIVDDLPGDFISGIAGKIGPALAGKALSGMGLGSVAEFLGLSESNKSLDEMNGKLDELIKDVALIDAKLDGISKQINDLENLLNKSTQYSTAWTSFSFFLSNYGSVQTKNYSTLTALQGIAGDYGTKTESYNTQLGHIMNDWYSVTDFNEYTNLTDMAAAIKGGGTAPSPPGVARYSLEAAFAENNTQALPGYFNFINRVFTDFSIGVLLCSGAMKYALENNKADSSLIVTQMTDLRKTYIDVLNYLYAAPEPEYVKARKQYELFSTAQNKTTDDYVYFYAQGNTPARAVLKDSTVMTTVHKDLLVLTPGQKFTPDVRYGTVGSSRAYKLTSLNAPVAVNGGAITAASPGFARVVVSSQKGVANFFVHVIDTTGDTTKTAAPTPAVANAVSSPEEFWNALDSNKNITLINNIDLTGYKSKLAAASRNLGDLAPSHSVGSISDGHLAHGYYWHAFLSVPSSYRLLSQKTYTSVLDGNGFTIILPGAVLLSNIGSGGQVKNLTIYFTEYYSQINKQHFATAMPSVGKDEEWEIGLNAITLENHGLIENVALIGAQTSAGSANVMIAGANYGTISLCFNQQAVPTAGPSPLNASLAFANLATGIIQGCGVIRTVQSRAVLIGYNSGSIASCFIRAPGSADATIDFGWYASTVTLCDVGSYTGRHCGGTLYNNTVLVNAANYGASGRVENSYAYSTTTVSYAKSGGWTYYFASASRVYDNDYVGLGDGDSYYDSHESNNVSGQDESTMKNAATLSTLNTGLKDGIVWEKGADGFPWPVGPGGHLQNLQKRRGL